MINDIIIQYLSIYPDYMKKIDSWNFVLRLEEVLQDHLQLYEQYREDFIKNEKVFKYTMSQDQILVSYLRTQLTYYLLVLKKIPIYQEHIQQYQELSRKIRSVNKLIRSKHKETKESFSLEEQEQ